VSISRTDSITPHSAHVVLVGASLAAPAGVAWSSGLPIAVGIHAMNAAVTTAQSKAVATLAIHVSWCGK
jgi:hypothetical protein